MNVLVHTFRELFEFLKPFTPIYDHAHAHCGCDRQG